MDRCIYCSRHEQKISEPNPGNTSKTYVQSEENVSLSDLRSGKVGRVRPDGAAKLLGRSVRALYEDRRRGRGLKFQRSTGGSIWYLAADILAELDRPLFANTNQYQNQKIDQLANARARRRERTT